MIPGEPAFLGPVLELIVKSVVVLAVALTLTWFMRRSSAAVRHLCLSAAAVALLALPVASVLLPPRNIVPLPDAFVAGRDALPGGPAEVSSREEGEAAIDPSAAGAADRSRRWSRWALLLWVGGASILLLRLIGGKIYGHRVAASAPRVEDQKILDLVRRASRQLGISRAIPVVESDHLSVPFVCGLFRPRLVLPPRAVEWPPERIEAVLRHELGHVKRRDLLVQFLAQIACCVYWVNPLAWIMERKLLIERERACDDIALTHDTKASDYAEYLMEVMEELGGTRNRVWVMSAMAEGTDFKDRVLSLLDPAARRTAAGSGHTVAVIALASVLLGLLASVHPVSRASRIRADATVAVGPGDRAGAVDDSSTRALLMVLAEADADMREHAATALGESGDAGAVPGLIEALDDGSRSVREHVVTALGRIGDGTAIPPLIRVLRHDREPRVREHAASALGMIGKSETAYRSLVESYETDRNIRVRAHAAYGMGLMREERAFDLLIDGLDSRHPEIRSHCADALGLIGDPRAERYLERALGDRDASVREAARRALKMMREKP